MLPNQMHEFASAKKYYCLTIYINLPSPKKTNMKMHEQIGDDRGNIFGFQDILHWMMLAEPAVLAGSQPDGSPTPHPPGRRCHKKNHQMQPLHYNNDQPKTDGNVNNNASSFFSTQTESTKSSGTPLIRPAVILAGRTATPN